MKTILIFSIFLFSNLGMADDKEQPQKRDQSQARNSLPRNPANEPSKYKMVYDPEDPDANVSGYVKRPYSKEEDQRN
jgi:flagellar basal body rod protein FlgC